MNFEEFLKLNEPALSEDELYEIRLESEVAVFEAEEADIKAADVWIRSLEPDEDEINRRYEML